MRVWSRTASMSEPRQRLRVRRKQAFAGADDQGQRLGGEGVVAQAGAIQLVEDELLQWFRDSNAAARPSR